MTKVSYSSEAQKSDSSLDVACRRVVPINCYLMPGRVGTVIAKNCKNKCRNEKSSGAGVLPLVCMQGQRSRNAKD
eukprot:scaffold127676_cov19-Tisochrysis_lutea.AAC.2